jgi:hypothetical protein
MHPPRDPPDGTGGGADSDAGSSAEFGSPSRLSSGLRTTLEEFGIPRPSAEADYALGRLAGLELASVLGVRTARRALARERQLLLRCCFAALDPRRLEHGDAELLRGPPQSVD